MRGVIADELHRLAVRIDGKKAKVSVESTLEVQAEQRT